MRFDCTTDKYEQLYARWLANPGSLLDLAGYQPGQRLLDLCGGTGAVSLEALRRGAPPESILLVDLNPRCPRKDIEQVAANANRLGPEVFGPRQPGCLGAFDTVVCRQALAYLDSLGNIALWLHAILKPGGKFAFNTFTSPKFALKTYKFGGKRFMEASAFWKRTVWHVQASPGIGIDVTRFHWHSEDDLHRVFNPFFRCSVVDDGKSQRWVCVRRET